MLIWLDRSPRQRVDPPLSRSLSFSIYLCSCRRASYVVRKCSFLWNRTDTHLLLSSMWLCSSVFESNRCAGQCGKKPEQSLLAVRIYGREKKSKLQQNEGSKRGPRKAVEY